MLKDVVTEVHTGPGSEDGLLKDVVTEVHTGPGSEYGLLKDVVTEVHTGPGSEYGLLKDVVTEVHTGPGSEDGVLKDVVTICSNNVRLTNENKDCLVEPIRVTVQQPCMQKIAAALETWMTGSSQPTSNYSSIPPIHDVCPSLVQRSLFMSQLRRNATSMCYSICAEESLDDVIDFASSFT